MGMSYSDLLRDPRWQRKRLEVMHRAHFACEHCGDTTTTLNVHHVEYVRGRMPWEYSGRELRCLCEPCHARGHGLHVDAPRVHRRAPRVPVTEREQAIMDRMSAIDLELPVASESGKDELIREKLQLTEEFRSMGKRWVKSFR
jgi:hypothetical protein